MEWAWGVLEGSHEEVRALSALAVPSVMSNFLEGGLGVVDVMMLGYLGKGHLASLSVGNAFFNIFWYFIEGFLTAQHTFKRTSELPRVSSMGIRLCTSDGTRAAGALASPLAGRAVE